MSFDDRDMTEITLDDVSRFRLRLAKRRRAEGIPNTELEFVRFLMNTLDEADVEILRLRNELAALKRDKGVAE